MSPAPPAAQQPSVSGDMLGVGPSRGWNYQTTYGGTPLTLTIYADPSKVNGVQSLIAAGVTGLVPTVATSSANMTANLAGALGVTSDAAFNYTAVSEVSAGSTAAIPGSPTLIPSTLTLGQTWSSSGATATVIGVGSVPNASACPTPASGATVKFTYANYSYNVSYVPGCGITDFYNNANGAEFKLISVGTYASVGQMGIARKAQTATLLDTAASLLGQRRSNFAASKLFHF